MVLLLLAILSALCLALPLPSKICIVISIFSAGAQKIYALRVAFDEAIFRHWADSWSIYDEKHQARELLATDLAELDHALISAGLMKASKNKGRDLDSRLRGAMGLLKTQAFLFTLQFASTVCAALALQLPLVD